MNIFQKTIYYIIYLLFYIISLLPDFILYGISDILFIFLYYLFPYRKKLVRKNLTNAFPHKSLPEIIKIEKKFYHNFIDTVLETIQYISLTPQKISKKFKSNIQNYPVLLENTHKVQTVTGHFMNWEMINLGCSHELPVLLGVYMPLSNKIFEKLICKIRTKFNTILIPATNFKTHFEQYENIPYNLFLVADQNPAGPNNGYWISFLNQYVPFIFGPENGAKKNNTQLYYLQIKRIKRGKYEVEYQLITNNPQPFKDGELTRLFVKKLEEDIIAQADNYLWTHKRWKYNLKDYPNNDFKILN